jgi:Circularly permutated YpsA SLOG family
MLTVVSGGQTGVDRSALDAAIEAHLPYRGWCPKGGWAEDCPNPPGVRARYPDLEETPDAAPAQRTEWNVRDSDALIVLVDGGGLAISKGTTLALKQAQVMGKPHILINVDSPDAPTLAKDFLHSSNARAVCIAGPRESEAPGIYDKAKEVLLKAFARSSRSTRPLASGLAVKKA